MNTKTKIIKRADEIYSLLEQGHRLIQVISSLPHTTIKRSAYSIDGCEVYSISGKKIVDDAKCFVIEHKVGDDGVIIKQWKLSSF